MKKKIYILGIILGILLTAIIFKGLNKNDILKQANKRYEKMVNTIKIGNISDEYLNYLKLSDEEKKTFIKPRSFDVPYETEIKSLPFSKLPQSFEAPSTLPESYNLVEQDCVTPVKDQGLWGFCWAYAGTTSLESHILNTTRNSHTENCGSLELDYNPMHTGYFLSYNFANDISNKYGTKVLDQGGNSPDNLVYYSSGFGPVKTSDFEVSSYDSKLAISATNILIETDNVKLEGMYLFPQLDLNYASSAQLDEFVTLIKNTLIEKGAINFASGAPVSGLSYYSSANYAVKTNTLNEAYAAPHMMTIVGWDDNFSKNNFSADHIPSNDGAWIVQNSWGNDVGQNGIFYYSYEDYALNNWDMAAISEVSEINYDMIYQYNPTGDILQSSGKYAVNIFDKESQEDEYINEISFLNFYKNVKYKIYVNSNFDASGSGEPNIADFTLAKEYTDNNDFSDYITIKLDSPIKITGSKFAIMLEIVDAAGNTYNIPVQIASHNQLTDEQVDVAPGQSFLSMQGTDWQDASSLQILNSLNNSVGASVMVKAFTTFSSTDPFIVDNKLISDEITLSSTSSFLSTVHAINIPTNEELTYIINKTDGTNVTEKFNIKKSYNFNSFFAEITPKYSNREEIFRDKDFELIVSYGDSQKNTSFSLENKMILGFKLTETELYAEVGYSAIDIYDFIDTELKDFAYENFSISVQDSNVAQIVDKQLVIKSLGTTQVNFETTDGSNHSNQLTLNVVDPRSSLEGEGTSANPFVISDISDLRFLNLNGYSFELENDLDLTDATSSGGIFYNNGKGFNPIGYTTYNYNSDEKLKIIHDFSINLFGNYKTIYGLNINRPEEDYTAFISYNRLGIIKNLTIKDSEIIGKNYTAAFLSHVSETEMTGLKNYASVYGDSNVAGIVAQMEYSSIRNSYNNGTVTAEATKVPSSNGLGYILGGKVGGIVSSTSVSVIENVFNAGKISTLKYVDSVDAAGIACSTYKTTIRNAYNTGDIYADRRSAGIVSHSLGSIIIDKVYNIGKVEVETDDPIIMEEYLNPAGIISLINDFSLGEGDDPIYSITNAFDILDDIPLIALISSEVPLVVSNSFEKEIDELKNHETYASSFDFENVWNQNENSFPTLKNMEHIFITDFNLYDYTTESYLESFSVIETSLDQIKIYEIKTTPENADIKDFKFNVDDPSILNITQTDNQINITPLKIGQTNISLKTTDGTNIKKIFTVKINSELSNLLEGNGTVENPYLLSEASHLNLIRQDLGAHYKLANNIDLTEATSEGGMFYNSGAGWEPIGKIDYKWENDEFKKYDDSFYGSFDGDNHTISGLYSNRPDENAALFGDVSKKEDFPKPVIKNLTLTNSNISARYAAAIVINLENAELYNIENSGNITASDSAAGIVMNIYNSKIEKVFNKGKINSKYLGEDDYSYCVAGGIFSSAMDSNINEVYNIGEITSGCLAGGIGGFISNSEVSNIFNTGTITGNWIGGIAANSGTGTNINNFYNTGEIKFNEIENEDSKRGIIVGYANGTNFINGYYQGDGNMIGGVYIPTPEDDFEVEENVTTNVHQKNISELKLPGTYVGFDFETIWEIRNIGAIPTLKSIPYEFVSSIEIEDEITLNIDDTAELEYIIYPLSAENKNVRFSSSDSNVAEVSSLGIITAKSAGSAVITIEALDGGRTSQTVLVTVLYDDGQILTSDEYTIDDIYIEDIKDGTTKTELLNNLETEQGEIVIDSDNEYVGTGTEVRIVQEETTLKTYYIVVKGDTDGDGEVTAGDAYDIILHSIGRRILDYIYSKAADVDGDGDITAGDAYDIILYSIGRSESL